MRKLIFAWSYVEWGGAQTSSIAIIREASKTFEVSVVMPIGSSPDLCKFLTDAGANCEFFGEPMDLGSAKTLRRKIERRRRTIGSERSLIKYLLDKDLTNAVIHVDFAPQKTLISLLRLTRRAHVFLTMHNSFPPVGKLREFVWSIKLRTLSLVKRFHIFCANDDVRKYIRSYLSAEAADRIVIVRDAIDPTAISAILARSVNKENLLRSLELPTDKRIILTVGQFIDRKGRWPYLAALEKILSTRRDLSFVWVMPELPDERDRDKIRNYDLKGSFHPVRSRTLGAERSDVLSFFRVADLFVLPSFVEGVPISLIEAMSLGVPCVSTNVHGIPEAIDSGKTGILVEAGDVDALVSAIVRLADDERLARTLADAGQEFVLKTFDERKSAQIAVAEYEKCLSD